MEPVSPYFDFCIPEKIYLDGNFENTAKMLFDLGYRTIAIDQVLVESNVQTNKKKKKGEPRDNPDPVPPPIQIKELSSFKDFRILNRLTVSFSNQDIIHKFVKSPNFRKYDIIAVLPLTQAALQFVCSNMEADILTFDAENGANYKLNRKIYTQIINKGIHFEILYAPCIEDSTKRKNTIQAVHSYHSYGKSKNVIISSGATEKLYFRSPYDVTNLALIFGFNNVQARNVMNESGRNVYLNSVSRRLGKAVMFVNNLKEVQINEKSESFTDDEMEVDQPALKKCKQ